MPATVDAGDLLLCHIALETANLGVPTPGTPTGWTLLDSDETNSAKDAWTGWFAKVADGTEDGGTVDFASSVNAVAAAQVHRVTSWFGSLTGVEIGISSNAAVSTPNPPSLTASWGSADNLWFVSCGSYTNLGTVSSYPSTFTNGVQTLGGDTTDGAAIATAWLESATDTLDPGTFTLSETERCHTNTIVVRPAAATDPEGSLVGGKLIRGGLLMHGVLVR